MYYGMHEFVALNTFFVKKNPIKKSIGEPYVSLKCPHTTIAHIHSLKANAKNQGTLPPPLSPDTCISSTRCTIMCKHQYKANATSVLSFSQDDSPYSSFLPHQCKIQIIIIIIIKTSEEGMPLFFHQ